MSYSMCCWRVTTQRFIVQFGLPEVILTSSLFLNFISCCLLKNVYAPIAVASSMEGFLGRIFVGKFPTHVHYLPCLWLLVFPDTDNNLLFKCIIAFNILDFVNISCKKGIRCCSHFCRSNKIFWPLCGVILCFILQFCTQSYTKFCFILLRSYTTIALL